MDSYVFFYILFLFLINFIFKINNFISFSFLNKFLIIKNKIILFLIIIFSFLGLPPFVNFYLKLHIILMYYIKSGYAGSILSIIFNIALLYIYIIFLLIFVSGYFNNIYIRNLLFYYFNKCYLYNTYIINIIIFFIIFLNFFFFLNYNILFLIYNNTTF